MYQIVAQVARELESATMRSSIEKKSAGCCPKWREIRFGARVCQIEEELDLVRMRAKL